MLRTQLNAFILSLFIVDLCGSLSNELDFHSYGILFSVQLPLIHVKSICMNELKDVNRIENFIFFR